MVVNSIKDQWNMLRMIADLSYLIHSNPKIKWADVFYSSKKMGVFRMILTGLFLMSEITSESLPDEVIHEIGKDNSVGYCRVIES